MNILFISRAFPPIIGGIEKQNYELFEALKITNKDSNVDCIVNTKGKKFLAFFLPYAFIIGIFKARHYDAILLGDAVLSPLGLLLKLITGTPVFSIIHGLDISFNNALYQKIVCQFSLAKLNHLFAVGNSTKLIALEKGIKAAHISFIPNGIKEANNLDENFTPSFASQIQKPFCLSLGRLIKRKGVAWFIDNVVQELPDNMQYVIAGNGPENHTIKEKSNNLDNVIFLGEVSELEKLWLYQNAKIFIQANIPVENDIEGFGLAVLEAAVNQCIVLASQLEGLQDAIQHQKNGYLIPHSNAQAWAKKITQLTTSTTPETIEKFKHYSLEHYHWNNIAKQYTDKMSFEMDNAE